MIRSLGARRSLEIIATLTVTVAVGAAASYLQKSISKQEMALALYREFSASEPAKQLTEMFFETDYEKWKSGQGQGSEVESLALRLHANPDAILSLIAGFLDRVVLVEACRSNNLCDEHSIMTLFRSSVLTAFFAADALIYCNDYVWKRYGQGVPDHDGAYAHRQSELYRVETLVMKLLEEEERVFDTGTPVFRNRRIRDDAKSRDEILRSASVRIVAVGRESQRCKDFKKAMGALEARTSFKLSHPGWRGHGR